MTMNRLLVAAPLLATAQAAPEPGHCFRVRLDDKWGWNPIAGECDWKGTAEDYSSPNSFDDKYECEEASKQCKPLGTVTDELFALVKKGNKQGLQAFLDKYFVDDARVFLAAQKEDVTPLHKATQFGKSNIVRTLLEHMAKVCARDTSKYLDLKDERYEYLQEKNRMGRTAMDIAEKRKFTEIASLLKTAEIVSSDAMDELLEFIEEDELAKFKKLLAKLTQNADAALFLRERHGWMSQFTLVEYTVFYEHEPILEALLDHLKERYGQNEVVRAQVKSSLTKRLLDYRESKDGNIVSWPLPFSAAQKRLVEKYLRETAVMSPQLRA